MSVGFNAGILVKPWPTTRIGVHYRSGIDHTLKGRAQLSGLTGPLAAANSSADAKARLRLPDIATVGLAQEVTAGLTLLADVQWFNWSRFNEVRVRSADGADDVVLPEDYHRFLRGFGRRRVSLEPRFEPSRGDFASRRRRRATVIAQPACLKATTTPSASAAATGRSPTSADAVVDLAVFHTRAERANVDLSRTFFAGTPAAGSVDIRGQADTHATTLAVELRYRF